MAGRILVLDDEENYAEMLQDLLRDNNYRVDMATRPESAINQLEETPYDLVISDYKMPVMDGADFLKKSRELYPDLPFILVSGLMNTPELVKVANMSVTLVMEKPLDTEVFLKQVARFSEPMTEEEKNRQQEEGMDEVAGGAAPTCPEEPRFFSAGSVSAKRFLQKAWSLASTSNELFVFAPKGSDAGLAVKDISAWRGNNDLPVAQLDLPASNDDAIAELQLLRAKQAHSNTVCFQLSSDSEMARARELTLKASAELEGGDDMCFVYLLESDAAPSLLSASRGRGVVLPDLNERPLDLACYARRLVRIASERSGKKNCSGFAPEAVYLLLAYDWPGGYQEMQDAITQAVESSDQDEPLSVERLQQAIGAEDFPMQKPGSRLEELMKKAQRHYFDKQMLAGGLSASDLAGKLDLDPSVQNRDDLMNLPLVKSELANL